MYAEFLKMKEFFTEREDEYAVYRVKRLGFGDARSDYCDTDRFRDGFHIEFDWRTDDPTRYGIESYDSFVFGIYCAYYGDRIEFTDFNRTWECGVEAYEGTSLMAEHFDEVESFINKHGYCFSDKNRQGTVIHKVTSPETFVRDAIELVRVMLTINCIDDTAPYVHEDNTDVLHDIAALEQSWLGDTPRRARPKPSKRVIDLTHTVSADMPTYPGDEPPVLTAEDERERGGARVTKISINSHTGTHIDAPSHFFEGARTLSDFTPDAFTGKALVIDCRHLKPGEQITKELILSYGDKLKEADFLLFNTGWDKKWGTPEYFTGYPIFDLWGAMLTYKGDYKGIGFDTPSIDLPEDERFYRHKQILSDNNVFVIENLKSLELLGNEPVPFAVLPLKVDECDGAPARAIAWVD